LVVEESSVSVPASYARVTDKVIGAALKVHSRLGPGLLESVYETCLAYELSKAGLTVERQKPLPVVYGDVTLEAGYRLDMLVENTVVVEIKAVEELAPIHGAQLLTYLKLSGYDVGLLINFNVEHLRSEIRRIVHRA
jgi:GxxExxY protein